MDLRLAERIALKTFTLPSQATLDAPIESIRLCHYMGLEADVIKKSPKFVFDNVAELYAASPKQEWDMQKDMPNWAPPFQHFFAEWKQPRLWDRGSGLVTEPPTSALHGFFVQAAEVNKQNADQIELWQRHLGMMVGCKSVLGSDIREALQASKWVLGCSPWTSTNLKPVCGKPLWLGYAEAIFVSAEGRLVDRLQFGHTLKFLLSLPGDQVNSPLHILGLGISFCHCRNVTRERQVIDRGERWHRRTKVPSMRFYTLEIQQMKEVLRREGRSAETGLQRALHLCRGHFAVYGPDNPLFGKYVGTFWKPAHERGSIKQGVVGKDYRVQLP